MYGAVPGLKEIPENTQGHQQRTPFLSVYGGKKDLTLGTGIPIPTTEWQSSQPRSVFSGEQAAESSYKNRTGLFVGDSQQPSG